MIKLENISFSYTVNKPVLKNISLDINDGECVILLGPNGVGKSTLISLLLGANKPQEGNIYFDNISIKEIKSKDKAAQIAYIPQVIEGTDLTVFDTVLLGRLPYYKIYPTKADIDLVDFYLNKFNLSKLKEKQTNEISGGERQIVSIARGFIQDSKTIIFDEPTSNLDISTQLRVINFIKEEKKNKSFIISMHDINQALQIGDKFVFLKDGEIYKITTKEEISEDIINKVYNVHSTIIKRKEGEFIIYEK